MLDLKPLGEWTVEQLAEAVLEKIPDVFHWVKGYMSSGSRFCLLGAYADVLYGGNLSLKRFDESFYTRDYDHIFLRRLREVIDAQYHIGCSADSDHDIIWRFNDRPFTAYEDIRLVLEKVRAG
jgi:hypothetical protein